MSTKGINMRSGKFLEPILVDWVDQGAALKAYLELDPSEETISHDMNAALQYAHSKDLVLVTYNSTGQDLSIILDSSFAGRKPASVLYVDGADANLMVATTEFSPPGAVQAKLEEMQAARPTLSYILEGEELTEGDMIDGTPRAVAFFPRSILLEALKEEDGVYKLSPEAIFRSLVQSVAELKDTDHYKPDSKLLIAALDFAGLKHEGEIPSELVGTFKISTDKSNKSSIVELRTRYLDPIPVVEEEEEEQDEDAQEQKSEEDEAEELRNSFPNSKRKQGSDNTGSSEDTDFRIPKKQKGNKRKSPLKQEPLDSDDERENGKQGRPTRSNSYHSYNSDENSKEPDSDVDEEMEGPVNQRFSQAKARLSLNLFDLSLSPEQLQANAAMQKAFGKIGCLSTFIQSNKQKAYLTFCKTVGGTFLQTPNDTVTTLLSQNKESMLPRALYTHVSDFMEELFGEEIDSHEQPCSKAIGELFGGNIFKNRRANSFEEMKGFSFMSIVLDEEKAKKINGYTYQIGFTAEVLILQWEFFVAYLASALSSNAWKDSQPKHLGHRKQSALVFIALKIRRLIKANKEFINKVMKSPEAREDICTRIHNSFIATVFSKAVTRDEGLTAADVKVSIIDKIVENDYRPPQRRNNRDRGQKDREGGYANDNNRNRSEQYNDRGRGRQHRNQGFFVFDFAKAMRASKDNKDSVPKVQGKAVCLVCAANGANSCKKKFKSLYHGAFTDDDAEKMKRFGNDNNFEMKKRDVKISTVEDTFEQETSAPSSKMKIEELEPTGGEPTQSVHKDSSSTEEETKSSLTTKDHSTERTEMEGIDKPKGGPSILVATLFAAFKSTTPTPRKSKFFFENNARSAALNSNIFKAYNYDAVAAINSDVGSDIQPGSEMKDPSVLNPVFDLHEDAERLKEINSVGLKYPLDEDYDETEQLMDRPHARSMGNNKSTIGKEEFIKRNYDKETRRHWMIPVLKRTLVEMLNVFCIKIGIATQYTINEKNEVIEKDRITHDCSQPLQSGKSVNLRCKKDDMDECRFGLCLQRFLFQIHGLRLKYPKEPILVGKFDMDSAYRRIFVWLKHALMCTTIVGHIAYLLTRLPFGAAPAAGGFSVVSEFVADTAQALVEDETWDHEEFHSDLTEGIEPFQEEFDEPEPLVQVRPLLIEVEAKDTSIECYIDDFIVTTINRLKDMALRAFRAIPTVLDSIFRRVAKDEPAERAPILQAAKLKAEGTLREKNKVLGWNVATRSMHLSITEQKEKMILSMITKFKEMYQNQSEISREDRKELESLIGKLVDISFLLIVSRSLLNHLRHRLKYSQYPKPTGMPFNINKRFDEYEFKDLETWEKIVADLANKGRHINGVLPTIPHIATVSDASEFGIRGYFILWDCIICFRFELPSDLIRKLSLNLLEFLAQVYITEEATKFIRNFFTGPFTNLTVGDSKSALSWIRSSKFNAHTTPAHDHASSIAIQHQLQEQIQNHDAHLAGEKNLIADSFSRDFNFPLPQLCYLFQTEKAVESLRRRHIITFEPDEERLSFLLRSTARLYNGKRPELTKHKRGDFLSGLGISDSSELVGSAGIHTSSVTEAFKAWKGLTSSPKLEGIQQTIGVVCQKFEDEGYPDPSRTASGRLRCELKDLYKSFKDEDPAVFKRAALSSDMRKHLRKGKGNELADAIGELVDGGIFFAMRSCEYCFTSDPNPKTKIVTLGDIKFLKTGREVKTDLEEADTVIITFRAQKNGVKDEEQARISSRIATWSAVKCWAKIVLRIRGYRGTDDKTPISTVKVNGRFYQIKASDVNAEIKRAASATGAKLELGKYSSHSVRVTFATLLFLKSEPMDVVKFLGRWKSDAFLLYIRNTIRMMNTETEMEIEYEQVA